MNSMIYNPLEEFQSKYKDLHNETTNKYFDELVARSGVNIEENRKTVREHDELKSLLKKTKRKFNFLRFLRVVMIITIILIPIVIIFLTPKIKKMRSEIAQSDQKIDELMALAQSQMAPLNSLFCDRDALNIIESTLPLLSFKQNFSVDQENDMRINYDFNDHDDVEQSTIDVLAGHYNENPFYTTDPETQLVVPRS